VSSSGCSRWSNVTTACFFTHGRKPRRSSRPSLPPGVERLALHHSRKLCRSFCVCSVPVITTGIPHRWIAAVLVVSPGRASHSPNPKKTCSRRGKIRPMSRPCLLRTVICSFCGASPGGQAIDRVVDFFVRRQAWPMWYLSGSWVPHGGAQRADRFGPLVLHEVVKRPTNVCSVCTIVRNGRDFPRFCRLR
jgi:hypothetical protein